MKRWGVALALVGACVSMTACGGGESEGGGGGAGTEAAEGPLSQTEIIDKIRASAVDISVRAGDEGFGGTGIVIDSAKGLVITNYHVIAGSTATNVRWNDTTRAASVVGQAPCEDIALIKMVQPIQGLRNIEWGSARKLKAGEQLTAAGFPGSAQAGQAKLTSNTGSASVDGVVDVDLGTDNPSYPEVVQHEVPINAGNSGGPLVDSRGRLVGVNTFSSGSEGSQNQNYSIAAERVQELLPVLKAGKNIAYMGLELLSLKGVPDEELAEELGWVISTEDIGMLVTNVDQGSSADGAGIVRGDYIEKMNRATLNSVEEVCQIAESNEGKKVEVLGYYMDEGNKDSQGNAIEPGARWTVEVTVGK